MDQKLSFYVVDDDIYFVEYAISLLDAAGHKTAHNESARAALAEIITQKPDCVLLDIMMPEMDGLELCRQLRNDRRLEDTKIVIVTAKPYEFDRKRALSFGADGYVIKPIDKERFVADLEKIIEDRLELAFWGVRGTLPVPGERSTRYGGNTSCVSLGFSKDDLFIFDAGSGIKALSDHLAAQKRLKLEAKIFISHPHWDHINTLPFFSPVFMPGNEFEILGASHGDVTMRELISAQMDGVYFPIKIKEFAARVYFRNLKEEQFSIGDVSIRTMLLNHPGYCIGYRVEHRGRTVCYVTDNEIYPESAQYYNPAYMRKLTDFVRKADILITDCTYTAAEYVSKISWGHSSVDEVARLAAAAEVKRLFLFHHDPDQSDDDIDAKLETASAILQTSSTECIAPREGQLVSV